MAYEWNKTAFVDFEAMLRRRLRSGAAPVTPCAGFDLDAASAYLEDALGGSHRAGYESHLAGCAACRRHLIELARLEWTAPQVVAQPVKVADRTPAWIRWREVVAGWFDLSTRNLKWQLAGATGAAFAILIAVLGVQSLRQAPNRAADANLAGMPSATPAPADGAGFYPAQSPDPKSSLQDAITPVPENLATNNPGPSRASVPAPNVELKEKELAAEVRASQKAMTLPENQSGEAPNVAIPGGVVAVQNPPSQPRNFLELSALSNQSGSVFIINDQAANDTVQSMRITPAPEINPMNPGQAEPNHQTRVSEIQMESIGSYFREPSPRRPQAKPRPEPLKLSGIAGSLISRIRSKPKSESARKDDAEASENESPKLMLIPIRDKVFRFERGMLIDREYNPVMQNWRVWTLKRGSEAYKQVLANEPLLKEFFDRAPILIVWKNRIYKALK